jgi:hypothetical protein
MELVRELLLLWLRELELRRLLLLPTPPPPPLLLLLLLLLLLDLFLLLRVFSFVTASGCGISGSGGCALLSMWKSSRPITIMPSVRPALHTSDTGSRLGPLICKVMHTSRAS